MSQRKAEPLSPPDPRNIVSPHIENDDQVNQNQEAMDVEQSDRLRSWFDETTGAHNPTNAEQQTGDCTEKPDDEEHDEASATGVVEATFENIVVYQHGHFKSDVRLSGGGTMIRCLPWKILVIFHPTEVGSLGFFLQCNADSESQTWSCTGKAKLSLVAQRSSGKDKMMSIHHTFTHKENDWGYQNFITYDELFNPDRGFIGPNGSILLRAHVTADAPHGADWDSKRHTGFVGLKNQGATCYLNSLLQALYCTNKLRRAVFLMPTESDDSLTSVPLALQRVFYELQLHDRAVGTKKLTRSFGWATLDSFMQHDAQELCRVLLDNLENKMKGTSVEEVIPGLFCGKMLSYIRCINVPYESKREEKFYDIQLKVNGNRTIYDAFAEYVAKETLTQDNKYDAGEYGLQEAEKGVTFVRFPPVLYLQLMRFQYDFVTDTNVKINDRFEFNYTLNLDNFLLHPDTNSPADYFLHAVLVHSGDNHGGHYVAYINPLGNGHWYQFDDDVVSRCSTRDAIYMNYGGSTDPDMRPCTNAYMLVYIAESAKADVLRPLGHEDIPETLRERFIEEHNLEEAKRLDKERGHLFLVIYLLLEEDFYGWQGPELCNQELLLSRMFRVPKQTSRAQLIDEVTKFLNHPPDSIQLWHFRPRRKNIPIHLVELTDNPLQTTSKDGHVFFVQRTMKPPVSSPRLSSQPTSDQRLFFVKYFDPVAWSMTFCGHVALGADECLNSLEPILRDRAGLPEVPLIFYHEDPKLGFAEFVQLNMPISKLYRREHQGHLIYFQIKPGHFPVQSSGLSRSPEMGTDALTHFADISNNSPASRSDSPVVGSTKSNVDGVNGLTAPQHLNNDDETGKPLSNLTIDPAVLRRMAALPATLNAKAVNPVNPSTVLLAQTLSPTVHGCQLIHSEMNSIHNYFKCYVQQVDILLVDKMRPTDAGILLRVYADLPYWEFANVVAAILSTRNDRLQFFRSHQAHGNAPNPVTAPISVSPIGTMTSELNVSPIASDLGSGLVTSNNAGSVDNASSGTGSSTVMDPMLSPQAMTARASGFCGDTNYWSNLVTLAATHGLAQEPPGAAIPSTHPGSLRDFFLPFSVSPVNPSWSSDFGPGMVRSCLQSSDPVTATSVDRFPVPLNRYCGVKTVNRTPFGTYTFTPPRRVYYAHLALRIDELETMRQVRVVYIDPKLTPKAELLLSVPQNGLVSDLLKEASRHLIISSEGSGQLRLFDIVGNRIIQEFPPSIKLSSIPQSTLLSQPSHTDTRVHSLRIEEVPLDEVNLKADETIVYVSHFDKELNDTFGIPFTVRIRDGEHYSAVRERIRRRLEVPEKEFERWRFAIIFPTEASYIPTDDDPIIYTKVFHHAPENRPWLGIEHKPSKRPRYAPNEKPIKIHN